MLDRRSFLTAAAGITGSLTLPALLPELIASAPQDLPPSTLGDDQYWAEIRKLFLIPADEIYLNNGTCGSSPTPVLRAVVDSSLGAATSV